MGFENDMKAAKRAAAEALKARKTVKNLEEQTLTEITNNLNAVTSKVEELSTNLNNISQSLSALSSSINTIKQNITVLENRILKLESK